MTPTDFPPWVVMRNGAPMFPLRDLLKATGHRPFFIRGGLFTLDRVRWFLNRSDKPLAPVLLRQIEEAARGGHDHASRLH